MSLKKYKCHKEVHAEKITSVIVLSAEAARENYGRERGAALLVSDEPENPRLVDNTYMDKHHPKAGGYYVQYEDGYESFSPAEAFEEGYTLV